MSPYKINRLYQALSASITAPVTELVYASPFELLIAVILSAQATDTSVNQATSGLFAKANTPEALLALGEHRGQVLAHSERAWASITFAGARHVFTLLFAGDDSVAAGERFVAALPEHEFVLSGQLVADASVTEVEHRLLPSPRLVVTCEVLMLEEG